MARTLPMLSETDLERALFRKGVGELAAERHVCAECGRSPLIGERIYLYARGAEVCALCRPQRRTEPERTELVRHDEFGQTVRVRRLRAA